MCLLVKQLEIDRSRVQLDHVKWQEYDVSLINSQGFVLGLATYSTL